MIGKKEVEQRQRLGRQIELQRLAVLDLRRLDLEHGAAPERGGCRWHAGCAGGS